MQFCLKEEGKEKGRKEGNKVGRKEGRKGETKLSKTITQRCQKQSRVGKDSQRQGGLEDQRKGKE